MVESLCCWCSQFFVMHSLGLMHVFVFLCCVTIVVVFCNLLCRDSTIVRVCVCVCVCVCERERESEPACCYLCSLVLCMLLI